MDSKAQQNTWHELMHAFAAHLRLAAWLNEGLAIVRVDRFVERPTAKEETLAALARSPGAAGSGRYPRFAAQDPNAFLYLYVRGYWLVRHIEETQPGLLKSLLTRRYRHDELKSQIASAYGMGREAFWRTIDRIVATRFATWSVPDGQARQR